MPDSFLKMLHCYTCIHHVHVWLTCHKPTYTYMYYTQRHFRMHYIFLFHPPPPLLPSNFFFGPSIYPQSIKWGKLNLFKPKSLDWFVMNKIKIILLKMINIITYMYCFWMELCPLISFSLFLSNLNLTTGTPVSSSGWSSGGHYNLPEALTQIASLWYVAIFYLNDRSTAYSEWGVFSCITCAEIFSIFHSRGENWNLSQKFYSAYI